MALVGQEAGTAVANQSSLHKTCPIIIVIIVIIITEIIIRNIVEASILLLITINIISPTAIDWLPATVRYGEVTGCPKLRKPNIQILTESMLHLLARPYSTQAFQDE